MNHPLLEKTIMQYSAVEWRFIIRNPKIGLPQPVVFDITLPKRSGEPVRAVASFADDGIPALYMGSHVLRLVRELLPYADLSSEVEEIEYGTYTIESYHVGIETA